MHPLISRLFALALALPLAACARDQWPDRPLTAVPPVKDELARAIDAHQGDTLVVISFSGGGVRASALAYGVLRELDRIKGADNRSLLDDVAVVSSVSGGSVTAGWYAWAGKERLAELERFLYADNMGALTGRVLNPVTLARLASPDFSRIDVVDEYFKDQLFGQATLGDVWKRNGPLLLLNATDMSSGQVFTYTQAMFNNLCADLGSFSLSTAVSSSAGVPIALTPVSLKNHTGLPECVVPPGPSVEIEAALRPANRWNALDRLSRAHWMEGLRNRGNIANQPDRSIDFVHLVDGGLIDNLGQTSLASQFAQSMPLLAAKGKKRLVWIMVNARASQPSDIDHDGDTPGLLDQVAAVMNIPIDGKTAATADMVNSYFSGMDNEQRNYAACRARLGADCAKLYPWGVASMPVRYAVSVDFDQFDESHAALRAKLKSAATSWSLPKDTIDDLLRGGPMLLRAHPCFQRLLSDMEIEKPAMPANQLQQVCPLASDGA